jgi:dephospho-CoA kinase
MAKISIQDLADSVELDQEAMRAILGGARSARGRLEELQKQEARSRESLRLVDLARNRRSGRR